MAGPESRIRDRYRKEATKLGHLVLVLHGSAYSGPGRADTLTLVRYPRYGRTSSGYGRWTAIEFKTPTGKATEMQIRFLLAVRDTGGYGFIARSAGSALRAIKLIARGICPYDPNKEDLELDLSFLDAIPPANSPEKPIYDAKFYAEAVAPAALVPDEWKTSVVGPNEWRTDDADLDATQERIATAVAPWTRIEPPTDAELAELNILIEEQVAVIDPPKRKRRTRAEIEADAQKNSAPFVQPAPLRDGGWLAANRAMNVEREPEEDEVLKATTESVSRFPSSGVMESMKEAAQAAGLLDTPNPQWVAELIGALDVNTQALNFLADDIRALREAMAERS